VPVVEETSDFVARLTEAKRARSLQDSFTEDDERTLRELIAAEARGDLEGAIDRCLRLPDVGPSPQLADLLELRWLGNGAPSWALARWLARQAHRRILFDIDPRIRECVIATTVVMHPDIDLPGLSPESLFEFGTLLATQSWVCGQLLVYEYGGLEDFLREHAAPSLIGRAGNVRDWTGARMGGYRIEDLDGRHLVITDLADGSRLRVLNLGAGNELGSDACVIGRVVAGSDGPMFESRPLELPEVVVREVARSERLVRQFGPLPDRCAIPDRPLPVWAIVLAEQVLAGRLDSSCDRGPSTLLTTDLVPDGFSPSVGPELEDEEDDPRVRELLAAGLSPVVANAVGVCEVALLAAGISGGRGAAVVAPHVAACLIVPGVVEAAVEHCAAPDQETAWRTLAETLVGPARERALEAAGCCRSRDTA
jgi:hypothetical protein